ncbi:unnamed protein product [Nezara viridula]|uniref:Uncharacterized protein n=1 Tax=Nezara viridula TaxID=85310 RepID=A0A9P0E9P7_NEZVI|nr:unnamed protein product [Nezara viridula]
MRGCCQLSSLRCALPAGLFFVNRVGSGLNPFSTNALCLLTASSSRLYPSRCVLPIYFGRGRDPVAGNELPKTGFETNANASFPTAATPPYLHSWTYSNYPNLPERLSYQI